VALAIVLLLGGAAVLTVGAEAAIRGAGGFARARRISPFVLGALLFGIDLESLGAALVAAARGQTAIAAGEMFGTIVFLFSAAFGAALLVAGKPVESPGRDMVLLPALGLAAGAMAISDQLVSRLEAIGLIGIYLVYMGAVIREGRAAQLRAETIERESREGPRLPSMVLLVIGLGLVYLGATVLVEGGVRLLDRTSLAAGFVGAALLGALASMDEVLLEVLPIRRGIPELATGNLFGTAAAFSSGVLGLAALVRPLEIDSAATSAFIAASVLYTVVATAFLANGRAGRGVGVVVLAVYVLWLLLASRL
jgi:cation:H+ antiporter